jgi:hypothetical protein
MYSKKEKNICFMYFFLTLSNITRMDTVLSAIGTKTRNLALFIRCPVNITNNTSKTSGPSIILAKSVGENFY